MWTPRGSRWCVPLGWCRAARLDARRAKPKGVDSPHAFYIPAVSRALRCRLWIYAICRDGLINTASRFRNQERGLRTRRSGDGARCSWRCGPGRAEEISLAGLWDTRVSVRGASSWGDGVARFRAVTLPMLAPTTLLSGDFHHRWFPTVSPST